MAVVKLVLGLTIDWGLLAILANTLESELSVDIPVSSILYTRLNLSRRSFTLAGL